MKFGPFYCVHIVLILLASALILSGCSNGFSEFYRGAELQEIQSNPKYTVTAAPRVGTLSAQESFGDMRERLYKEGYAYIGQAKWLGQGGETNGDALEQAKNVGAALVLWRQDYSHTESGIRPVTRYTPEKKYTEKVKREITINGKRTEITDKITRTKPGTSYTSFETYSNNLYHFVGYFFAKLRNDPSEPMWYTEEASKEFKQNIGMNSLRFIASVMEGGNAYNDDFMPDDVILEFNGQPYRNDSSYNKRHGENIVKIWRNGKIMTKRLHLQ